MYSLAFDTTSACCSVALFSDEQCKDIFVQEMDFGQAETLMPEIQKILNQNGLKFSDLGLITVCVGPGSFTGVRSSISAARSFGLACPHIEVMGVTAFEAYIQMLSETPEQIGDINAVIIETKREDFYFQLFDAHLHPISEPAAALHSDIIAMLRGHTVSFVGDGVERFLNVPTGLKIHSILNVNFPNIKNLARCGLRRFYDKRHNYPKPLYLRAPDVCVKS